MPQIRLDVSDSLIESINKAIREINGRRGQEASLSPNDIAREALAVYKWAVEQVRDGYAVVAVNSDRDPVVQIETPHLPARAPSQR